MTHRSAPRAAVILAAGKGERMRSPLPKVLHPIAGRAMIDHAIDAVHAAGCERVVVVVGTHSPLVREHVGKRLGAGAIAVQDPPLGTGHAVLAAKAALEGFDGDLLVTYGDVPLLRAQTLEGLFAAREAGADLAVLGFEAADPGAYGRLVLGEGDALERIVEAKEASPPSWRSAPATPASCWRRRPCCSSCWPTSAAPTPRANTTSPTWSAWPAGADAASRSPSPARTRWPGSIPRPSWRRPRRPSSAGRAPS